MLVIYTFSETLNHQAFLYRFSPLKLNKPFKTDFLKNVSSQRQEKRLFI